MATAGYAIRLNGTTQYVTVADNAHHDYATGDAFTFGVRFWLDYDYKTATKDQYIFDRQNQHSLRIADGGMLVYYFNGAGGAQTWRTGVRIVPERLHQVVVTGSESTNTTVNLYLDGVLAATTTLTGGMPADTTTAIYLGVDYAHSTAGQFLKGSLCEWFQSNTTAFTAANVVTAYNSGKPDIDTLEAITGLIDNVGFEENTGTSYAGGVASSAAGAGQGTPLWTVYGDLGLSYTSSGMTLGAVGEVYSRQLFLKSVAWQGDAIADADVVELTDVNGKTVWHEVAQADDTGKVKDFVPSQHTNGLKVKTLGHGTVYVYFA